MNLQKVNTKAKGKPMIICANLLVRHNEEYFVLQRSAKKEYAPNVVVPFGGKLDAGESALEAAVRELKEESGLTAKNIKLAAIVTEIHNDPAMLGDWLVYYFLGDYASGELIENPEGTSLKLSAVALSKQDLFPSFQLILPSLLKDDSRPIVAQVIFDENRKKVSHTLHTC